MIHAFIGTETGVYRLHPSELEPLGLEGRRVSALHALRNADGTTTLLAGTYGDGLYRRENGGRDWSAVSDGLTTPVFRTITADPAQSGAILCGTEPARIFRSHDGGVRWTEVPGIATHEDAEAWYLPYSPRAGAIRNIFGPPGTQRLLAALEVGGLLESRDGGDTWTCRTILGNGDIHFISGHPHDPEHLVAALGWAQAKNHPHRPEDPPMGGVGISRDGGHTWTAPHADYTRAVIIPPAQPDLILAGPAKKVGEMGRIEVSADGGATWQPAGHGLEAPMHDMVECFLAAPDGAIWALCAGGRLMQATPGEWHWRSLLPDGAGVRVQSVAFAN